MVVDRAPEWRSLKALVCNRGLGLEPTTRGMIGQ